MSEPSDSLVHQVLEAQIKYPTRNDWGLSIMKDLSDMDLNIDMLKNKTKNFLTNILKTKLKHWHLTISLKRRLSIKR